MQLRLRLTLRELNFLSRSLCLSHTSPNSEIFFPMRLNLAGDLFYVTLLNRLFLPNRVFGFLGNPGKSSANLRDRNKEKRFFQCLLALRVQGERGMCAQYLFLPVTYLARRLLSGFFYNQKTSRLPRDLFKNSRKLSRLNLDNWFYHRTILAVFNNKSFLSDFFA